MEPQYLWEGLITGIVVTILLGQSLCSEKYKLPKIIRTHQNTISN